MSLEQRTPVQLNETRLELIIYGFLQHHSLSRILLFSRIAMLVSIHCPAWFAYRDRVGRQVLGSRTHRRRNTASASTL